MRWPRADLEEKQEPRAATSGSAERRAEGMWHDVTRKSLTEAAIEKPTLSGEPPLSCRTFSRKSSHRIAAVCHDARGGPAPSNPTPSLLGFAAWSRANENSLAGSLPIFVPNVSNPPVNRPSGAARRASAMCQYATFARSRRTWILGTLSAIVSSEGDTLPCSAYDGGRKLTLVSESTLC